MPSTPWRAWTAAAYILEPFYTTKPVGKGTGLGLDICWRDRRAALPRRPVLHLDPGDRFQVLLSLVQAG